MEFLSNLTLVQWGLIGLGIFLLLSVVDFNLILDALKSKNKNNKMDTDSDPEALEPEEVYSLTELVSKWEQLRTACHKSNCTDACKELDKVFPLLRNLNNSKE
jgi:hypothetical protein